MSEEDALNAKKRKEKLLGKDCGILGFSRIISFPFQEQFS